MKYSVKFDIEFRKNNYPGKLITMEGIDGSGKTTQAEMLVGRLTGEGHNAIYTKEPTDGPIGKMIRQVLQGEVKVTPIALQYLFCADRAEHQKEIEEYLKEGKVVVSDRFFWSAVAYGIADIGGEEDFYLVALSVLSFYHRFMSADYTFFLDTPIDEAVRRILESKKHNELYDKREKLIRIDKVYKKLFDKFKEEFIVIDGNKSVEEISDELFQNVISNLK